MSTENIPRPDLYALVATSQITVTVEPEEFSVRGNVVSSGDESFDTEVENEILSEIENGNLWAWGFVTVRVSFPGIPEIFREESLGACSYQSEEDFRKSDYFSDMVQNARDELRKALFSAWNLLYSAGVEKGSKTNEISS